MQESLFSKLFKVNMKAFALSQCEDFSWGLACFDQLVSHFFFATGPNH